MVSKRSHTINKTHVFFSSKKQKTNKNIPYITRTIAKNNYTLDNQTRKQRN